MSAEPAVLELTNVSKRFPGATGTGEVAVLQRIDLRVRRGESVAIMGPSGSGKSTLLNIIGTLDVCTAGTVLLEGRPLAGLDELELARVRNRQIGFVFQAHHLLPQCTVLENVLLPTLAEPGRTADSKAATRAQSLLRRVGLEHRLSHRPGQLSGGEKQRVAVVRALINEPKLLLADEPTGALDRAAADNLGELLAALNREQQVTMILVTHARDLANRMQRLLELRDGVLVESPRSA